MKKIISALLATLIFACCLGTTAFAADETATVYVSIAAKGELVASQVKVTVSDIDNDGALTVNDALYAAHESAYNGGADKGYGYYIHKDYGLSLGKLWGDSSGNFGYYLNNSSCWSLSDNVKDGDWLNAFVYADGKTYSDAYCFFSDYTVSAKSGETIELTLNASGYDANWNPVTLPVANAEIIIDGVGTGIKTDSDGKAEIKIDKAGTHVISAVSSSQILVPPVCTAEIGGGFFSSLLANLISLFEIILNLFSLIF